MNRSRKCDLTRVVHSLQHVKISAVTSTATVSTEQLSLFPLIQRRRPTRAGEYGSEFSRLSSRAWPSDLDLSEKKSIAGHAADVK